LFSTIYLFIYFNIYRPGGPGVLHIKYITRKYKRNRGKEVGYYSRRYFYNNLRISWRKNKKENTKW
jgi:hypothetical protein